MQETSLSITPNGLQDMSNKLNMLSISDIHLGHNNVSSEFIIENLNRYIADRSNMADIDIIWIGGDVFDQLLYFSDTCINEIEMWMISLLNLCKKWDITLRILEGTPSHDRKQSIHFINKAKQLGITIDVKFIDILSIEYIEKYDIHVLYIPDEYHSTTEETWNAVQNLLIENNLNKVDYAIMHGMFDFQVPKGLKLSCHNSERYLSIVNKYIFVGHVHQMAQHERILSNGSFDRLRHAEEEDKGFWKVKAYRHSFSSDELEFIINEHAKIFKSFSWIGLNKTEICNKMKELENFPRDSYIKIEMYKEPEYISLYEFFKNGNPQFNWDYKVQTDIVGDISVRLVTYQPIPINSNTIESLLKEKFNKLGIDEIQQQKALSLLKTL